MNRSRCHPGLMLLASLILAVQMPVIGAAQEGPRVQTAPSAPQISLWYGNPQGFGALGNPQRQINILGNVSGASSLHYSLNGGPDIELAMGGSSAAAPNAEPGNQQPDQGEDSISIRGALGDPGPVAPDALAALLATASNRLVEPGDFNIEINTVDLNDGPNTVLVKANGGQTMETLTVNYSAGNTWPLPYTIDWDSVSDIRDVVQVVDGQWAKDGDKIRTMTTGYDRIVTLGDKVWDDFQVTVPVTIHDFPDPNAGGVGIAARWQGHFQVDDEQPGRGWWQIGAYAFYRNRDMQNGGPALSIFTGHYDLERDPSGYEVPLNTPHYFKLRAQTKVPGQSGFYSFKAWDVGTAEPETWTFEIQDTPPDEMFNGSVLLVAHEADASFGDIEILPVLDVNVETVGSGSVQVSPELTAVSDAYLYGDTIELTATPDPGWVFAGWSGSLSGVGNPATLTLADDAELTATFVPGQGFSLAVGTVGSGSVALDPAGGVYADGTVVTLMPQPAAGWEFGGWSGPNSADLANKGNGTWEVTMDGDKAVSATFARVDYTLATYVTGSGTVTKDPQQATYHYGDQVQLTAEPAAGWTFAGWSGDLSGSANPAMLTVDGNMAVTASFSDSTQSGAVDVRVAASDDDAEERIDTGSVARSGVDLELGEDSAPQIVGMRFQNVQIPQGAAIVSAYVEFSADETHSGATNLLFRAQASDDTAPFDDSDYDLSSRPKTTASAAWNDVAPWTTIHELYQSADISAIVQEVVNRPGWSAGNAMAIFVTGSGRRTAEAYNGEPTLAPKLHVAYGGSQQTCYSLATTVSPIGGAGSVGADPGPDCAGTQYSAGAQVQLTATASPGWTFAGWSGDLSGSANPATLTMDGNKSVTASFAQDDYPSPTGLSAAATSQTQIDLAWQDNAPDETAYHVERSPDGTTGWAEIDTVPAGVTTYQDNDLDCGFPYSYRVRAYWSGEDQYSAYSNVAGDTTPLCEAARTLAPGWNTVSWRVEPPDPSLAAVLSSIEGLYCRVLSQTGVHDCTLDPIYRTLDELPGAASYYLRLEGGSAADLRVLGYAIPVETPLPLEAGWNWIGYLPDTTLPIETALASIDGQYDLVHSLDQTYIAGDPLYSTLTHMEPGQGYMIHTTQATTLVYPTGAALAPATLSAEDLATCGAVSPTPTFTVVYGELLAGQEPAPLTTVVEVLTPRGEVAGCAVVRHEGQYGFMHVYGQDSGQPPIPGFRDGEPLAFRVNGLPATLSQEVTWTNDRLPQRVDLAVESVEFSSYLPLVVTAR